VRGKIKDFLYTEQIPEFPTLAINQTICEFQETTSSLWVILGRRAAVYRQDDSGPGWEFYEFNLASEDTVAACRAYTAGTDTPTSVARSGSTDAWTDPSYGAVDDTNYATCTPMSFGDKTELLRTGGIIPSSLLPVSATLTSVNLKIRHWLTGEIPVTHDHTKMVVSSTPSGSDVALDEVLTTDEATVTYAITTGLPSVADINAGNVGFETAYLAEVANGASTSGASWNIVKTGSTSAVFTIDVTYIGAGTAPSFVYLDVTSQATVQALANPPGTPSADPEIDGFADNGLTGGYTSGVFGTSPTTLVISTTERKKITLTAGVGQLVVTRSVGGSQVPPTVNWIASGLYTGNATFSAYTLSAVYVDSLEISYCYTVTSSVSSGISWNRACFTDTSKYLAGRSGGQLDLIEYDFRNESFIGGTGRDGGFMMPSGQLTMERLTFEGRTARMNGVQVNTVDPTDVFSAYNKVANGAFTLGTSTGLSTSRWVRFPVTELGLSHQVKVTFDEDLEGIDGLAVEYQVTSRSKVK
jgi:hypothetical protein